jgi:hypothetical protein
LASQLTSWFGFVTEIGLTAGLAMFAPEVRSALAEQTLPTGAPVTFTKVSAPFAISFQMKGVFVAVGSGVGLTVGVEVGVVVGVGVGVAVDPLLGLGVAVALGVVEAVVTRPGAPQAPATTIRAHSNGTAAMGHRTSGADDTPRREDRQHTFRNPARWASSGSRSFPGPRRPAR